MGESGSAVVGQRAELGVYRAACAGRRRGAVSGAALRAEAAEPQM